MTSPNATQGLYVDFSIPLGLYSLVQNVIANTQDNPNTPQITTPPANQVWFSQPRPSSASFTEVIQVNFKLPLSVSEIGWDALRCSAHWECWYQDRQNNWRQMMDDSLNPITLDLSTSQASSWYTAHFYAYQIVAKAIQFRITRLADPTVGQLPYCVGMRNGLIRRNIYARSDGTQGIEPQQDAIGNTVTAYIQDWDAPQAIDNNASTFWRSAAMPDPQAVCNLYLDIRDAGGNPQLIDSLYLDPIYGSGTQQLNIYYSNDDTEPTLKLSPISLQPSTTENINWALGIGLSDTSATSNYQFPFAWGPLIDTDAWVGIEWKPNFSPTNSNAVQSVTITGAPTGGTFTLTYGGHTTVGMPLTYTSTQVGAALQALSSIGTNNVVVGGPTGGPYTVTFTGTLGGEAITTMTATPSFTGGTSPGVTVATVTPGGVGGAPAENPVLFNVTPLASAGTNAVQTISFVGTPDGGTFTLTFGGHTTSPLAYNCTAANVQTALQALSSIGSGNAIVAGVAGDANSPWTVEFVGSLADAPQALITTASTLTGTGTATPTVSVLSTTTGAPQITTESTGQFTPKIYYDAGAGEIVLKLTDGSTIYTVNAPLSPIFQLGQTLRILVGWTYETTPTIVMKVCLADGTPLSSVSTTSPAPPSMISFDGLISFSDFAGLFTAHVIKLENWNVGSTSFLANPQMYVSPDPVQPDSSGNIPATTLDNAIYAAAWPMQQFGTGGGHATKYVAKTWTPIFANYLVQKGTLFLPQAILVKYLDLEFTNLTEESYPVYDSGIQVSYQSFPVGVTSTTTQSNPGLIGIAKGLLSVASDVLLTGIGTVNWLNPSTVNNAVNSVFGATTTPAIVTSGPGVNTSQLPNTTALDLAAQTRNEVSTSWVYKRNPLSPTTLVAQALHTITGGIPVQGLQTAASTISGAVANAFGPTQAFVNNIATLPQQGSDWWVFPGATLRMPATLMNGLTAITQTVLGRPPTITRNRFTTTSVHQYTVNTVNRDASVAYFAGIAEVQPYVTTYIGGDDPAQFSFSSYDPSQWTFTNIKALDSGPITTSGALYNLINPQFDTDISNWTQTQGIWFWNSSLGHWYLGTAGVTADGTQKTLRSNLMDVLPGAVLEANVWVTWSGLTATSGSEAIQLQAQFFNNGVFVSSQAVGITNSPWPTSTPESAGNVWAQIVASGGSGFTAPGGVNQVALALVVTSAATAGQINFDTVEIGSPSPVEGTAFKDFVTYSSFARLACNFTDSGVVRSDDMWEREDPNDTNIAFTTLAYYTSTIPDQIPAGMWADSFATWSDPVISWGEPAAVVAINVDPNRIFNGKRVLHFTRASGAGEAGIKVRQATNFVANGLCRLGCVFYKPNANDDQITIQLRRVSDGVYIWQETFNPVVGFWYNYVTSFFDLPNSDDQIYTVEFVTTGDAADEIYLNDLYSEVAQVRYLVQLGGEEAFLHDVTPLAYGGATAVVSTTVPVTEFSCQTVILTPDAFAYGASFVPTYLQ